MAIKFKSQATGDLVMVQATAEAVLGLIGKSADAPGILEPADMPAALQALKNAPDENPSGQSPDPDQPAPGFQDEVVSLRKHAYPLVLMIERALKAGKSIVWGV